MVVSDGGQRVGEIRQLMVMRCEDRLRKRARFFFSSRRRHTRWPRDWSSDVCSSDLLVILDTLAPAERLAFVLHDVFDIPFEEIAPIVGRTPTAARQLASRARRRV